MPSTVNTFQEIADSASRRVIDNELEGDEYGIWAMAYLADLAQALQRLEYNTAYLLALEAMPHDPRDLLPSTGLTMTIPETLKAWEKELHERVNYTLQALRTDIPGG